MKCKYGEFSFPSEAGFSGSAGKTMVRGYARGGPVKPVPVKAVAQKLAQHVSQPASVAHPKTGRK